MVVRPGCVVKVPSTAIDCRQFHHGVRYTGAFWEVLSVCRLSSDDIVGSVTLITHLSPQWRRLETCDTFRSKKPLGVRSAKPGAPDIKVSHVHSLPACNHMVSTIYDASMSRYCGDAQSNAREDTV